MSGGTFIGAGFVALPPVQSQGLFGPARTTQGGPLSWHFAKSPGIPLPTKHSDATLTGVACPTPKFCVAAGALYRATAAGAEEPLVEEYNGAKWSLEHLSVPGAGRASSSDQLLGLSCASVDFCMALGDLDALTGRPLVEVYDGARWSPGTPPAMNARFTAVSCASVGFCVVVGLDYAPRQDLISYVYRSGRWSSLPFASSPPGVNALDGVACTAVSFCQAVGYLSSGGPNTMRFAEDYSGSHWAVNESHSLLAPHYNSSLADVSCYKDGACLAVGSIATEPWHGGSTPFGPFAEYLANGRWRSVLSPATAGLGHASSQGVSCTEQGCTVIGMEDGAALVLRYASGRWAAPTYGPHLPGNETTTMGFSSLSCPTPGFCVAVGGAAGEPVIMMGVSPA